MTDKDFDRRIAREGGSKRDGKQDQRKIAPLIAIEEHCVVPLPHLQSSTAFQRFRPEFIQGVGERLKNVQQRLEIMDANNIQAHIVSLNNPGAQGLTDLASAIELCTSANEQIYEDYVQKHPKRFFGFATLPTQSGEAAARELERCITKYGFVGAMINGFTNTTDPTKGIYLDDRQFDALWEVAERFEVPIFLHPRIPLACNLQNLQDAPFFHGSTWGFARETVEHCLRMMYFGVFDRFPKLKIALGHMGEALSFILPRMDSTARNYNDDTRGHMKKTFVEYLQNNFLISTSGIPRISALQNVLAEMHSSKVLFSTDYPYESIAEFRQWFEGIPVDEETWKDIGYRNAIRWFKLPLDLD